MRVYLFSAGTVQISGHCLQFLHLTGPYRLKFSLCQCIHEAPKGEYTAFIAEKSILLFYLFKSILPFGQFSVIFIRQDWVKGGAGIILHIDGGCFSITATLHQNCGSSIFLAKEQVA